MGLVIGLMFVVALGALVAGLWRRHAFIWLPRWCLRELVREPVPPGATIDVMFCFVDHFEPRWGGAGEATEDERVRRWVDGYPRLCAGVRDADGCSPRHSFFFPSEEYRPRHIDALASLCRRGYGEIEIHLHHDNDTAAGLRANLGTFLEQLRGHGALPQDAAGAPRWAFVHGNWALDNSRPDGRWCGVNDELSVLAEMGCYADFTLPSAPSPTQTSTVNSIYYATDDPCRPKSHDRGEPVRVGGKPSGHLMIIQGPLGLRISRRGRLPKLAIENGDIRANNPPWPERVDAWVRAGIAVRGRPEWVFVKVHTHGTQDGDMDMLLGNPVRDMYRYLATRYNDGQHYRVHFVTAREMYNIVKAAEAGLEGDAGRYRDFVVPPAAATTKEQAP